MSEGRRKRGRGGRERVWREGGGEGEAEMERERGGGGGGVLVQSICTITSVPSVRLSVAGCPGARRGVPVDLTRHKGRSRSRVHCGGVSCKQGQADQHRSNS